MVEEHNLLQYIGICNFISNHFIFLLLKCTLDFFFLTPFCSLIESISSPLHSSLAFSRPLMLQVFSYFPWNNDKKVLAMQQLIENFNLNKIANKIAKLAARTV
jgi:hypothetical protein